MGTFSVQIQVSKPYSGEFASVDALVDTGASYSMFPSDMLDEIGVVVDETRAFDLADNRTVELPLGHAEIRVAGKQIITQVVFGPAGGSSLVGATTLEGAGLAVDPMRKLLVPVNGLLMSGLNGSFGNGRSDRSIPQ